MKILITNSVPLNGGDEALLRATVESLQARWPGCEITTLCSMPEQARLQLPDLSIESDLEFAGSATQREQISQLYRAADAVLSAPGGFLHDFYRVSERLRGFEVALALGKPVFLFAQSIGPFWKPESRIRIPEVLNRVSLICVRDAASKQHLLECGVTPSKIRETADAAFLWRQLAPDLYQQKSGPPRSIALSFRVWPLGDEQGMQKTVTNAERLCRHLLADSQRNLVFLSTCQGVEGYVDDSRLAGEIVHRLPQELQERCRIDRTRYHPRELIREYSRCDAFIGMRLHGCILAMLGGTPAMGLGYEQKTKEVFQQMAFGPYQLRFETEGDVWLRTADRFFNDIETVGAALPSRLDTQAARATLNLDFLEESLGAIAGPKRTQPRSDWTTLTAKYDVPHLRLRQVAKLVQRLQPKVLVDFGCGPAQLRHLCPETKYIGCDFVVSSDRQDFPLYQCDFNREALPADLQELELIVCSGLLEYIDDLPAFLGQLRSRLKPDGHLIATYFNMNHISRIWGLLRGKSFAVRPDWRGFYSPLELARLMVEAGFEITETFVMNHSLRPALPVEKTLDQRLMMPRARPWSTLLSHQFLFLAKPWPMNQIPMEQIDSVVPAGARFILVDEAQWSNAVFIGQRAVPFLERAGQYWGHPADDEEAERELERLRRETDVEYLIFGTPAFWWLDYYSKFALYLDSRFNCLTRNDRVIIYNLRTPLKSIPLHVAAEAIDSSRLQEQNG